MDVKVLKPFITTIADAIFEEIDKDRLIYTSYFKAGCLLLNIHTRVEDIEQTGILDTITDSYQRELMKSWWAKLKEINKLSDSIMDVFDAIDAEETK